MIVWRCKRCGFILHVEKRERSSSGVKSALSVIGMYDGVCPRCGRRLEPPSITAVVVRRASRG